MNKNNPLDEDAALRTILEGTATETGQRFFSALVQNLAKALGTHGSMMAEYLPHSGRARALAFWAGGEWLNGYEYDVADTPCGSVLGGARFLHHPDNVQALYPGDNDLKQLGAVSYMGVPLQDLDGTVLGHLAVFDNEPMPREPRGLTLFRIFAARAAAELQRLSAESEVRERQEKLGRLVDSALDAIIELDGNLELTLINPAAEKFFGCPKQDMVGRHFGEFLSKESEAKLGKLAQDLGTKPEGQRHLWIPGGLTARTKQGCELSAEATLSRSELRREVFYTLILRNVNERLEAERRIRSLKNETAYLKEEIKSIHNFDEIIGRSVVMENVLRDVQRVAATDATVLILGETGTGKELIARAIHAASGRRDQPLIKVNCATIPATLIESELFGHEAGAFTGATKKREGRFTLADGGTIFLDEIGELSIDLQAKLLRVLQEGEFEPVGSSRTRRVDVRVLGATNRDLQKAMREQTFREDLFYRLNVFPIRVPPLRERGDDVGLLTIAFTRKLSQQLGVSVEEPTGDVLRRLAAYRWPGNIRELHNVIERALITQENGRLNLARALPETALEAAVSPAPAPGKAAGIRTAKDLQDAEKENLIRALEASSWRVAGENGAAKLLGMNPSTLSSRLKALGIRRPT